MPVSSSAHGQDTARVRMDWGPVGARVTSAGAAVAVVVDVLSFTTTLSVAVEAGTVVYPYRWRDQSAVDYARSHDATLAVGRFEARDSDGLATVSLSPMSVRAASGLSRLVLPSPNGSTICAQLADAGVTVVGACLRNPAAVAGWLTARLGATPDAALTVIAAGERWPDGSLRPAVEDLWGAGAVIAALDQRGLTDLSPEAEVARLAFLNVRATLGDSLMRCASGRELSEASFAADVAAAAELDASEAVPLLVEGRFVNAAETG